MGKVQRAILDLLQDGDLWTMDQICDGLYPDFKKSSAKVAMAAMMHRGILISPKMDKLCIAPYWVPVLTRLRAE